MSLVFSRVNIISQSQHDAEVNNPSVPVPKPPRSYLQVLKDSINQEDNVDITSVASNSRSNEGWQDRISAAEAESNRQRTEWERKEQVMLELSSKFHVGAHVYTTNPAVASLPKRKRSKGKRRRRMKVYGKVVKQSQYQPRFWLVKFNNGKEFYCTVNVVHFVSNEAPNNGLGADEDGKLTTVPFDYNFINKEAIMTNILESKCPPSYANKSDITFEDVAKVYKGQYSWLNGRKLARHYSVCKHTLTDIKPISWVGKLELSLKLKHMSHIDVTSDHDEYVSSNDDDSLSSIKSKTHYADIAKQLEIRRKERRSKYKKFESSDDEDSSIDIATDNYISSLKELKDLTDQCNDQLGKLCTL